MPALYLEFGLSWTGMHRNLLLFGEAEADTSLMKLWHGFFLLEKEVMIFE
jgi:hypothetical protein